MIADITIIAAMILIWIELYEIRDELRKRR